VTLQLRTCVVRSWQPSDIASLVTYANNRQVWVHLRDRFPHPYTRRDGQQFIRSARNMQPETYFAIAANDEACGGVGVGMEPGAGRDPAEVGYWLGESVWGRGSVTEALIASSRHGIWQHALPRLFAVRFAHNVAPCSGLAKAGYVLEARLRRSAIKDGRIIDQCQYAFVAPEGFQRRDEQTT